MEKPMQKSAQQTKMDDDTGFRMSRIRAEGWKAAQIYLVSGNPGDEQKIAALNPHRTELERAQWHTGFNSAIERL
jgi:hypothetical protein